MIENFWLPACWAVHCVVDLRTKYLDSYIAMTLLIQPAEKELLRKLRLFVWKYRLAAKSGQMWRLIGEWCIVSTKLARILRSSSWFGFKKYSWTIFPIRRCKWTKTKYFKTIFFTEIFKMRYRDISILKRLGDRRWLLRYRYFWATRRPGGICCRGCKISEVTGVCFLHQSATNRAHSRLCFKPAGGLGSKNSKEINVAFPNW